MLPLDSKLGQVSSNYLGFFKELGKSQPTSRQTHVAVGLPLSLSGKGKGGMLETVPRCLGGHQEGLEAKGTPMRESATTYPHPPLKQN